MRRTGWGLMVLGFLAPARPGAGYQSGPPSDHVRIPWPLEAPRSCTTCHNDGLVNGFPGQLTVSERPALTPLPSEYEPGRTYALLVRLVDVAIPPARIRWGFELAVTTANRSQAGVLRAVDSTASIVSDSQRSLDFIRQTSTGSFQDGWQLEWTAPLPGAGAVTWYFCGNAGDGSGDATGDHIHCRTLTLAEPVCDPGSGAIRGLTAVRQMGDVAWTWEADPEAQMGYRLYAVPSKEELADANQSTPAARRMCSAPGVGDTGCLEAGAVGEPRNLFYQVVGVCATGLEGPN